jgi:hypothetical protein
LDCNLLIDFSPLSDLGCKGGVGVGLKV